ncbi:MAG TPA: large conductance mechanosensitive channel protein MscL [Acidimicrobiales bacterium]|nr:large conductance mechanosensitive channel protein MscL [Acidimicrobiales bacterium]
MRSIVKEFKDFIMRGNVIDLAVAVVVGAAFTQLVNSFAKDVLMQIVAIFTGKPNFGGLTVTANGSVIRYGSFLTAVVNFLIVAVAMFAVIKAINAMQHLRSRDEIEEATLTEVELLTQIRDALQAQQG